MTLQLPLAVKDWVVIDAVLDNLTDLAAQNGEADVVVWGTRLRQAGWDARAGIADQSGPAGWPSPDTTLRVEVEEADQEMILARLEESAAIDETVGQDPAGTRDAAAAVLAAWP